MFNQIIEGIGLGLIMALMIGPVFFMLINISIKNGFRSAVYFAFGVMLSDAFFITIIEFSKSLVGVINENRYWVALVGGVVLIAFGLSSIIKKVKDPKDIKIESDIGKLDLFLEAIKGFVMNSLNPFVLLFWLSISTTLVVSQPSNLRDTGIFFSSTLATIFITDLLKGAMAISLKKVMTVRFISILNKVSGAGLILFGFRLFYLISSNKI
jgi:threonine/homoserine/homoserine lactone efflux protein